MPQYYVIQVITGRECNVKEIFTKCSMTKFRSLDAEIIIPQAGFVEHVHKNQKNNSRSILPGYVLLRCYDLTHELYYSIRNISGVTRVFRINVHYEEVKKFIITYHEKLAEIKKRIEFAKKRALEKGKLKILFNRIVWKKQVVKVNFLKEKGYIPVCRLIRLLN